MKRAATLGLLLALLSGMFASGAPRTSVQGNVRDSEGAAIGDAYVIIHWDLSPGDNVAGPVADLTVRTDERGDFSADVAPGFYDVFVTSTAFSPTCRKVRAKMGQPAMATFSLSVDPGISKEIGTPLERAPK